MGSQLNLRKLTISSFKWAGSTKFILIILRFGVFAVLARFLAPSDFGIMSMIAVVIGFAQIFSDVGVNSAIIQRKEVTKNQLSSLYWLNIVAGIIAFAAFWLIEPIVQFYFKEPRLRDPYLLASFMIPMIAMGQQFQVLLQKEMNFKLLSKVEVLSRTCGYIVSIVLAYFEYGVFAIIWGQLITRAVHTLSMFWIARSRWLPHLHFKTKDLEGYLSFGFYRMGESFVNIFRSNVDYMIIGRLLGTQLLGYYTFAYEIMMTPMNQINPVITEVAFPAFSKIQDDNQALGRNFKRIVQLISLVAFPLLIGAATIGDTFISFIFGQKWLAALTPIQILAFVGCVRAILNPAGTVYLAKGRADLGFRVNLFMAVLNTFAIWVAARYNLLAVVWTVLGLYLTHYLLLSFYIGKLIQMKLKSLFKKLSPASIAASIMGASIILVKLFVERMCIAIPEPVLFFLLVIFGGSLYLFILNKYFNRMVTYYVNLIREK